MSTPEPVQPSSNRASSTTLEPSGALILASQCDDRPYTAHSASFSIPRRSVHHSNNSSTSDASLCPSNSASQKNFGAAFAPDTPTTQNEDLKRIALSYHEEVQSGKERQADTVYLDVPLPWRPLYLYRRVLVAFLMMFVACIVALETLYFYSAGNTGVMDGTRVARYLWACGPTAAFTIIAAAWNRVDYQSRYTAPWIRMAKGPAGAERTLLLDYLTMLQPVVVVRALQNHDISVAYVSAVGVALKLLVVISAGLVTSTFVKLGNQCIQVTLPLEFADDTTSLANATAAPFFTMVGLQENNMAYPDGISSRYAYQTFTSALRPSTSVNATVDGYSAGLDCQPAQLTIQNVQVSPSEQRMDVTLSIPDCSVTTTISSQALLASVSNSTAGLYLSRIGRSGCANSTRVDDQRIVVVSANQNILTTGPTTGGLPQSAQLICQPQHNISRVQVVKNLTTLSSISEAKRPKYRAMRNVRPWDVAEVFFSSHRASTASRFDDTTPWFYQPQSVNVDSAMYLALETRMKVSGTVPSPAMLLDSTTLQSVVGDYYQQFAAIIAAQYLTRKNLTSSDSFAIVDGERLLVRGLATHVMTGLLGASIILTVVAVFLVPRQGFLPRDPGTIIETAALIANSRPLLQGLRAAGGGDMGILKERVSDGSNFFTAVEAYEPAPSPTQGYFKILGGPGERNITSCDYFRPSRNFRYPFPLHPLQRAGAFVLVSGMLAALELTLRTSRRSGGFGEAGDDTYRHYLWTVIPVALLGIFTLYHSSCDFTVRSLAPFAELTKESTFEKSMIVNYLDRCGLTALYKAIQLRNPAVAGATIALMISSLFAITTSSLFYTATVPSIRPALLQTRDFFSSPESCTTCRNGVMLASLVLQNNISYPAFTHKDLVFPTLSLDNPFFDVSGLTVSATIPAVRTSMRCKLYQSTEVITYLKMDPSGNRAAFSLVVDLPGEPNGTIFMSTADMNPRAATTLVADPFFGTGRSAPFQIGDIRVSHWVYAWGQFAYSGSGSGSNTDSPSVRAVSALACNESVQQVDTAVTFLGSNLKIASPPTPNESTAKAFPGGLSDILQYDQMMDVQTPYPLDPFFGSLVTSRFAVPLSFLSNPTRSKDVASAIIQQHKIIRAQVVSTWNRIPIGTPGFTGNTSFTRYPATVALTELDSGARRRVVQDAVMTHVLVGLLGASMLASLVVWIAFPHSNILPRSPTSIASLAALLADGNIFGLLGRGVEWRPISELASYFKDGLHVTMDFRLGWDQVRRRRRERKYLKSHGPYLSRHSMR